MIENLSEIIRANVKQWAHDVFKIIPMETNHFINGMFSVRTSHSNTIARLCGHNLIIIFNRFDKSTLFYMIDNTKEKNINFSIHMLMGGEEMNDIQRTDTYRWIKSILLFLTLKFYVKFFLGFSDCAVDTNIRCNYSSIHFRC